MENSRTVFLRIYNGRLPITAQFFENRPYTNELPEGKYVYDIAQDIKTGEPKWLVKAAYRHRLGSIVTDRRLDITQKIYINEITFFEQCADVQEMTEEEKKIKESYEEIELEYAWCYEPYTNWNRPHFPDSVLDEAATHFKTKLIPK